MAQKAGGLIARVLPRVLAFFVGGLVVFATTGKNPLTTYRAIFEGAGFNWFFPWVPARGEFGGVGTCSRR